jgi:hypothetical protein
VDVVEGTWVSQDLETRTTRIVCRIGEALKASLPNPRTRLVKLNRVHRWLRWAEYPPLDKAIEGIEDFFGFLDDVS